MKRWPIAVAIAMLVTTWGSLQVLSHGEPMLMKKSFAQFPLAIGERWVGKELRMEQNVLDVLKLSDYMMRVYTPARAEPGISTPIWLYVGYYESQRTGATYHSPKNCLPGSGWQFVETDRVSVSVSDATSIQINKVLIQKGLEQQMILYWYQDRGRVIASEYSAKGYMIWDAMTQNRTDGSLVRISLPVTTTPENAYQDGVRFLLDIWPLLLDYMPTGERAT
jgi:EpsI family protein